MSDEEKNVIDLLKNIDKQKCLMLNCPVVKNNIERQLKIIELNRIIRKQSKEIEELKKQLDLDNECEIALNNRIMDLENADKKWADKIKAKIEEVKDGTFDAKIVLQSLLEKE